MPASAHWALPQWCLTPATALTKPPFNRSRRDRRSLASAVFWLATRSHPTTPRPLLQSPRQILPSSCATSTPLLAQDRARWVITLHAPAPSAWLPPPQPGDVRLL